VLMNRSGSSPVISAQSLTKDYEIYQQPHGLAGALKSLVHRQLTTVKAVDDVSLTVDHGEIVGLLGPNGAGKTTIVKMMCGLLLPTSGELTVCNERPATRSYALLSQISVMFGQKAMLWWDVSTRESLRIHRSMYQITTKNFAARVVELGQLLGITEILDTPVRNLSLGQRMRCELALALLHRPTLLFADEPTIGLDVEAKLIVRSLFLEINRTLGTTIVLTSHDMDDVEALTKRVIVVNGGRATFDGDLNELRSHAKLPKDVILTYRNGFHLPPEVSVASSLVEPHRVRLRLDGEPLGRLVQAASEWGDLVDFRIVEPKLDEVMSKIFREKRVRS